MSDDTERRDREAVSWFSTRMLRKLKLNEDKPGWHSDTQVSLLNRIFEEAQELREALLAYPRDSLEYFEETINEAADVANFAMMVADIARSKSEKLRTHLDLKAKSRRSTP